MKERRLICDAIERGTRGAHSRLSRLGATSDEQHRAIERIVDALSVEQRSRLIKDGLLATVRAHRALLESRPGDRIPIDALLCLIEELHASPWFFGPLKTDVEQDLNEILIRRYEFSLQEAYQYLTDEFIFEQSLPQADALP